MQSRLK